jgi:MFS family permease
VFLCFGVFGVFAGLAGRFLAGPLRHSSPALAGLATFVAFGVGALTQIATASLSVRRLVSLGVPVLIIGLAAIVAAAWVDPPSLALFLIGAAVIGVGTGCLFRAALTVVITTAPPDDRAGALAFFFVVGYFGISIPVVAAGIALQHVTFKIVLLVFGVVITAGILAATPLLLKLRPAAGDGSGRG